MTGFRIGLAGAKANIGVPQMLKGVVKRGGSGTAALTNTLDPTLYPTSPPQSSYIGGVPKIAGSKGGFIGLIVGLGVLIIILLFTAYYILRIRPRRQFNNKRSKFFSTNPLTNRLKKKHAGWVAQTDAFDYESDEDNRLIREAEVGGPYGAGGKGYIWHSKSRQASGMGQHDADADPFDPEKLPESVHQQQAPLSTKAVPTAVNTGSTGANDTVTPAYGYTAADITPTHSPRSPAFESGTRFKEQF